MDNPPSGNKVVFLLACCIFQEQIQMSMSWCGFLCECSVIWIMLMSWKKVCVLMSFAPCNDPSLFRGSLISSACISCLAPKLTYFHHVQKSSLCKSGNASSRTGTYKDRCLAHFGKSENMRHPLGLQVCVQGRPDPFEAHWWMLFAYSSHESGCDRIKSHKSIHLTPIQKPKVIAEKRIRAVIHRHTSQYYHSMH
jgi:hypothetical protein